MARKEEVRGEIEEAGGRRRVWRGPRGRRPVVEAAVERRRERRRGGAAARVDTR